MLKGLSQINNIHAHRCRVRAADNEDEECVQPHVRSPLVVSLHSHLAALIRTSDANHSPLQLIS